MLLSISQEPCGRAARLQDRKRLLRTLSVFCNIVLVLGGIQIPVLKYKQELETHAPQALCSEIPGERSQISLSMILMHTILHCTRLHVRISQKSSICFVAKTGCCVQLIQTGCTNLQKLAVSVLDAGG